MNQLRARGIDTAVVGGLATPICVQTTVDALSMVGIKVASVQDTETFLPAAELTARPPAG